MIGKNEQLNLNAKINAEKLRCKLTILQIKTLEVGEGVMGTRVVGDRGNGSLILHAAARQLRIFKCQKWTWREIPWEWETTNKQWWHCREWQTIGLLVFLYLPMYFLVKLFFPLNIQCTSKYQTQREIKEIGIFTAKLTT